jgi:hypothetical protein
MGAILFVLVDRYEKDKRIAKMLNVMLLVIASVANLLSLQPFGRELF